MKNFAFLLCLGLFQPILADEAVYCLGEGVDKGFWSSDDYSFGIIVSKFVITNKDTDETTSCEISFRDGQELKAFFEKEMQAGDESTSFSICGREFEFEITKFNCSTD